MKWKCWLGFHNWTAWALTRYYKTYTRKKVPIGKAKYRVCKDCYKKEYK